MKAFSDKAAFNFSSVQLTQAQIEVLSCGPRFGIPVISVCKEEIVSELEMFYQQVESRNHRWQRENAPSGKLS